MLLAAGARTTSDRHGTALQQARAALVTALEEEKMNVATCDALEATVALLAGAAPASATEEPSPCVLL